MTQLVFIILIIEIVNGIIFYFLLRHGKTEREQILKLAQDTITIAQKEKETVLAELSRATKAVIAKNANDYVMTTSIDKATSEVNPPTETDETTPMEALTDDEFDQAIKTQIEQTTPPEQTEPQDHEATGEE